MTRKRAEQYKPLLLSTTMRNPERMRPFLSVLKRFDGQLLTNDLCVEIEGELIRYGLYRPLNRSREIVVKWAESEPLDDLEVKKLLAYNPQKHKEAGFDWGWPSRFETHFALMKRFGFVYYRVGEKIRFSELGNMFVEEVSIEGAETSYKYDEELIFLNSFVKYHRRNPFQRVLNHNRPLILLIQTIKELESRPGNQTPGVGRHELPFLLVWRDADYVKLADYILDFREKWGFNASEEVIFDLCEQINGGWHAKMKMHTVVQEEPDETLRKFRLTGLISLRGNGRFVACNTDKSQVIEYVLKNHTELLEFDAEEDYFEFASSVDRDLVGLAASEVEHDPELENSFLNKWVSHFGEKTIRAELVNLSRKRPSTDSLLRLIPNPLRLEFLTTLLLKSSFKDARVIGHYKSDDEGFPISHAPGNTPDIEVFEGQLATLYEVTLMTGRIQVHQELVPITRHLEARIQNHPDATMFFIAPTIHDDARRYVAFLAFEEKMKITNQTIEEFAAL
jgi:AlwI restriction endonuclease